jgi:hypothetical protein
MPRPIGFSAFLKLLEISEGRRRSELKRKLGGGGGFNYWRPVQRAAPKAILPAASIEALRAGIDATCSGHQRQYNQNAFAAFCRWTRGKDIEPLFPLPPIEAAFGNSGLVVSLKPEVTFNLGGAARALHLWATTKPILSIPTLSVGLLFASRAYRAQGYRDHAHMILDTITNRSLQESDIIPTAIHLLKDRVDELKKIWDDLNPTPSASDAPESPTDQPPHFEILNSSGATMTDKRIYVEQRPEGDFAVRRQAFSHWRLSLQSH